jgi:hypothetical protein
VIKVAASVSAALLFFAIGSTTTLAQSESSQDSQQKSPESVLRRAWDAMGASRTSGKLVHYTGAASLNHNYESDRTYPPYLAFIQAEEVWFNPETAIERSNLAITYPLSKRQTSTVLTDSNRAFSVTDRGFQVSSRIAMQSRYLNPWLVVADWLRSGGARITGLETYRDYPRTVLSRTTANGDERLFLDPKSGFPVKLDFLQKHYLWGQRHIEYLYTTWQASHGVSLPCASYLLADGIPEITLSISDLDLVSVDSVSSMALPTEPASSEDTLPRFLQALPLKFTQVGSSTYLLANPGYAEVVTKIGDEVFLLDTTQSEQRAREDAEAIERLFPGSHKITVIVTDLAWPHVAGVRYWVASGATIVAHKAARDFLQQVIDRRWTLAPDYLEQHRKDAKFKFVGVDSPYSLAGGALTLHPIDGIASEVALMAFLREEYFLWASDYIQDVSEPTQYASEIWAAVHRDALLPERVAAEHLPLTSWVKIEELQSQITKPAAP